MEIDQKLSGIYKITTLHNNKIYIGSAVILRKRRANHLRDFRNNKHSNIHLQRVYNKYGVENFKFEFLINCNKEDLINIEQKYIDDLNPYYNMQRIAGGSALGLKRTPETCKKISDSLMGKKLSEKHKLNLSLAKLGKSCGDNNNSAVGILQYNLDGSFVKKYGSIVTAWKETNIIKTGIVNCLRGRSKQSGGFIWKYEMEVTIGK